MKKYAFSPPYAAAALSAFITLFINFNALFNYGSGYDTPILVINFILFSGWMTGYLIERNNKIPILYILFFLLLFFCCTLPFYQKIFDGVTAVLDISGSINAGKLAPDTLYHSAIVESIVNYSVPSVLINHNDILYYHNFSHLLLALIGKVTGLPAIFIYSYIYPQLFISLFMFLYVRLILAIGKHFNCHSSISLITGCFLLLFENFLLTPGLVIYSQSFFVSIVICLIYLNLFEKFNLFSNAKREKHPFYFISSLVIFIFIISLTKISTGFIFVVGATWYFLRQRIPLNQKIILASLSVLSFFSALVCFLGPPSGALDALPPHQEITKWRIIYFMKYYKTMAIAPLLVIIIRSYIFFRRSTLKKLPHQHKTAIEEATCVCLFSCILSTLFFPGFFFFFLAALSFFGLVGLYYTLSEFYLPNINLNYSRQFFLWIALCAISCYFLHNSIINDFKVLLNTFRNIKYQRSIQAGTQNIPGVLSYKKYFSKSRLFESKPYSMITAMRNISKGDRKSYGIFVTDDKYKFTYPLAEVFYYQALTGIVRLFPLYRTEKGILTNSGRLLTKEQKYPFYGLGTVTIPSSVSLDAALKAAKTDGKKYIFHISKDNLYLIDAETKLSKPIPLQSSGNTLKP